MEQLQAQLRKLALAAVGRCWKLSTDSDAASALLKMSWAVVPTESSVSVANSPPPVRELDGFLRNSN